MIIIKINHSNNIIVNKTDLNVSYGMPFRLQYILCNLM